MSNYRYDDARGGTHQQLLDMVPEGSRVLDLGCASGFLGRELMGEGRRVWGVEADDTSRNGALEAGYEDVLLADLDVLAGLPWNEQFDVVIAADVLEHLKHPDNILGLVRERWLAPAGSLLISVPNIANFTTRLALLRGRFRYTETGILDQTHLRFYTYESARQLMARNRFEVLEERAGSDRFGVLLDRVPGARRLAGLLAFDIVLRSRAMMPNNTELAPGPHQLDVGLGG